MNNTKKLLLALLLTSSVTTGFGMNQEGNSVLGKRKLEDTTLKDNQNVKKIETEKLNLTQLPEEILAIIQTYVANDKNKRQEDRIEDLQKNLKNFGLVNYKFYGIQERFLPSILSEVFEYCASDSPLIWAARNNNIRAVEIILEQMPNEIIRNGKKAFKAAIENNNHKIAKILVEDSNMILNKCINKLPVNSIKPNSEWHEVMCSALKNPNINYIANNNSSLLFNDMSEIGNFHNLSPSNKNLFESLLVFSIESFAKEFPEEEFELFKVFFTATLKNPTTVINTKIKLSNIILDSLPHLGNTNLKKPLSNCCEVTLLHVAVIINNYYIAELLLQHGAYVNSFSGEGHRPLWYALQNKNQKMIELLLDNGAINR